MSPTVTRCVRAAVLLSAVTSVLMAVTASTAMAAPTARAASVGSCLDAFGSFAAGNWPAACWHPYGLTSPFNVELPAHPRISPDSAAVIADLVHYGYGFHGGPSEFALTSNGRDAVYYSQPSDPVVTINCTYYWGPGTCQGSNRVDINRMRIHLPAGAQPEHGPDHHMTVIDQTDELEYDFDQASVSGRTLTVWAGGELPIGTNAGTGLGVPGTAAGFSVLAGLIRAPELAGNSIDHALTVSIPCTEGSVWPAGGANGFPCSRAGQSPPPGEMAPALGTLFQLDMSDAEIAASRAPSWQRAVMTAMAHYGLYVNDTNGGGTTFYTETESDTTYTSVGGAPQMANLFRRLGGSYWRPQAVWILAGRTIPLSRLRVIDPCVPRRTCISQARLKDQQRTPAQAHASGTCGRPSSKRRRGRRRAARCVRQSSYARGV